ncbi:MAG: flavin reductase family protein [Chloroflexi bacterium]|nr:flavin reductase family protein [Chloroflexota bacterium]
MAKSKNIDTPELRSLADPESMRRAMRQWVAGVTVVTSRFGEVQHGMTVSSFTSISLTPPMILVSLERSTRTHGLISASGYFGVTILSGAQKQLSETFAGRIGSDEDRFKDIETFNLLSPAPFLKRGLAFLDCRVVNVVEAGTSTVFFAEVMAAQSGEDFDPLAYTNRSYFTLEPLKE